MCSTTAESEKVEFSLAAVEAVEEVADYSDLNWGAKKAALGEDTAVFAEAVVDFYGNKP